MIEKNSSIPMYEQIAVQLKNDILQKRYEANGNIGTQKQLAEDFGVSLITVRKAIELLASEGLLEVVQGKGTFVRNTVFQDELNRLTGVSNIILESHLSANILVLAFEIIDTPRHFDNQLRDGLGKKCLHIERVHEVKGVRAAYADLYVPQKYGKRMSEADIRESTIYQIYENKWNMRLGKGKQTICAGRASERVAEALEIEPGWPVLLIRRRAYDANGELVEYMELAYEYTQYSFEVELLLSSQ